MAALPALLPHQGFGTPRMLSHSDWQILVFGKYGGGNPTVVEHDGANFAACSGTLLYDGKIGEPALAAILRESHEGQIAWDRVYGSFCLLLCQNGVLWLMADRLGVYPIYRHADGAIISTSFISLLEAVAEPTPDPQSIYEYVFQGATYQNRTAIGQIRLLERGYRFRLSTDIEKDRVLPRPAPPAGWQDSSSHLARSHAALRRQFASFRTAFGQFDTALSGGYDSRLILALLRDQQIDARLHVYGRKNDADVTIAEAIAKGERLTLRHVDKTSLVAPSTEEFASIVARNFVLFDGYPSDGIFDPGTDAESRLERAGGGALALNGGGGEIFRNFFYLPDRDWTVRDLVWSFFSQFDPAICTKEFDERTYVHHMAAAIGDVLCLDVPDDRIETAKLARWQVEYLYPHLRCVFWMGRNNSVNNRLGFAATPFIEPEMLELAAQIPIGLKNHGIYEAELIRLIDPALARYPSAYGGSFNEPPSLSRRLKTYSTMLRPPRLRRLSYRLQNRSRSMERPRLLRTDYLRPLIDPTFPAMGRFFQIGKVKSDLEFNRICTLEYLFSGRHRSPLDPQK